MKTYLQNGTVIDTEGFECKDDMFFIQILDSVAENPHIYPQDDINHILEGELVALYDKVRDIFFTDADEYYKQCHLMPIFIQTAGQDSDCGMTSELFQQMIQANRNSAIDLYRHLYLVDCQFLIGTIQNLVSGIEDSFTNYFIKISGINNPHIFNPDTTYFVMSQSVRSISSSLESYFTKAYSILDMLCKLAFEIEFPMQDFSKYSKMKSTKLLWGDRKKLKINESADTLFEKCDLIRTIESLRNEVVHNGSWELNPKIFISIENGEAIERFMLFPDVEDGHLVKVKNRRHFFGNGTKVNDVLPEIHNQFLTRLLNTVKILNQWQLT